MDIEALQKKREESQKRIQEAFKLVKKTARQWQKDENKKEEEIKLSLSDIVRKPNNTSQEFVYYSDFERETVFGFNVRLKSDDVIIPLLGGDIWNAYNKNGENFSNVIDPGLTIPEIFKDSEYRVIQFRLDANNKVKDRFCINDNEVKQIEDEKSFACVQKKYLFNGTKDVYFWIGRECDDLLRDGTQYLSNILVVSSKEEHLHFVKRHHIDFLRFLFQMELAYASLLEKAKKVESIKSAIAAIMSRNMSHNLGSHYLYYTKNQLASLADSFDEAGPEIRGAAKVLGYMQARMDYLATIVSGDKYPYGAVFFKGQIFDELTIDDFSKRHFHDEIDEESGKNKKFKRTTNYLLQNLVLSENFTRQSVLEVQGGKIKEGAKGIRIQIKYKDYTFTGLAENEGREEKAKLAISRLCIALPGGVMSIHAFYNVIENLIRNSAKYHKNDFKEELLFTIRINELKPDVENSLPARYEFIIFDNKANALEPYSSEDQRPLIKKMNSELCGLKILTDKNELDKSAKGLKEMLFSTLWMRAYTYEKSKHMSDILAEIDQLSGAAKFDEIRQHSFEYVAVDDEGRFVAVDDEDEKKNKQSINLGVRFELPKYCMMENVSAEELSSNLIEKGLNNYTDILCVDSRYPNLQSLQTKFTRVYEGMQIDVNNEKDAVVVFREILNRRFPSFDQYKLQMDTRAEKGFSRCDERQYGIYFKTHVADLGVMNQFAYCEAISGENFTKTMLNLFNTGFNVFGGYKDDSSEYFALKIKEAALTRITLIDERLYNDMVSQKKKKDYLSLKNIRVLNLKNSGNEYSIRTDGTLSVCELFDGNEFRDHKDATHFLSIHLGMVEKIVKDDSKWVKTFNMETKSINDRVNLFMGQLKKSFKHETGDVFISIHSGRGNFSPELDDSLKSYPFISISALESTYSNSKFLVTQLFYNTVYIGKGVSNAGK